MEPSVCVVRRPSVVASDRIDVPRGAEPSIPSSQTSMPPTWNAARAPPSPATAVQLGKYDRAKGGERFEWFAQHSTWLVQGKTL